MSISHAKSELRSRIIAYAIRVAMLCRSQSLLSREAQHCPIHLLLNFPHILHSAEQVAAPQQEAPIVISCQVVSDESIGNGATGRTVPTLGRASRGRESRAPMIAELVWELRLRIRERSR